MGKAFIDIHTEPVGQLPEPSWERIVPEESHRFYRYFLAYRDCNADDLLASRAYTKAIRQITGKEKVTPTMHSLFIRLNRQFRWQERVQAWDAYINNLENQRIAKETLALRAKRRDFRLDLAQEMQTAAMAILKQADLVPEIGPDGKIKLKMTPAQARRLLDVTTKLADKGVSIERLEDGQATEISVQVSQHLEDILSTARMTLPAEEYERLYQALTSKYSAVLGTEGG